MELEVARLQAGATNLPEQPSAEIGVVEVQKPLVFFAISAVLAPPSAGIGVEVQKLEVFCVFCCPRDLSRFDIPARKHFPRRATRTRLFFVHSPNAIVCSFGGSRFAITNPKQASTLATEGGAQQARAQRAARGVKKVFFLGRWLPCLLRAPLCR